MKKFFCILLSVCLILSFSGCTTLSNISRKNDKKVLKKYLFIGTSYTYTNDLPDMFKELVKSGGYNVYVDQSAGPSYSLEQHAYPSSDAWEGETGRNTLKKIKKTKWDYVILQEQSQHPAYPDLRVSMYKASRKLDKLIKANGSKTAFFMAWGFRNGDFVHSDVKETQTFEGMQEQIRIGYTKIANELSALLVPVGIAWLKAVKQDPKIDLWQNDDVHPTIEGTYLSCCVFYMKLFHKSPVGLKYNAGLSTKEAEFLQTIAYETCKDQK